jgi:long-chain acyl-CoA synthetase
MLTLPSVLQRTVRLYGARTAIRDTEGDLTWTTYVERVARAAGALRALGIRPGDRFAILCRNCVRQAELIHAGYWSGAIPVPVNYRLAPPEIAEVLKDAECRVVAVENVFAGMLDRAPLEEWSGRAFCIAPGRTDVPLPHYDALRTEAHPIDPFDPAEDDDAILLYTGGTTGRGKGVRLTHRNIVSNALQLARVMKVGEDDVYLHSSPMFHSTDLKATVCTTLGAGHAYLAEYTPVNVLAAIARHRVTIASLVPTVVIRLLQDPDFGLHDISSLRLISYGTSSIAAEWIRRTMDAFPGVDMHQCYGLTETSPILAILDETAHRRALTGEESLLRSVGRALVGVDLRILDDDGAEVPNGDAGEIVVRGPQVAKGYHNRPKENAEAFRDGWFHTGDVGRVDAEGFLYMLDRKKEMVVTGGENVYTSEVEAALYQHPAVNEAAVIGVPDEQFGEALFAVIVPAPGTSPNTEELVAHCRGRIGGYKIPRRMAFVDALPKSAMGKVLKHELRRQYGDSAPSMAPVGTEKREKAG